MEGVGNDDIIYYIINYVIGISGNRDTCSWNWRCGVYRSIRRCDRMYINNSLDHEENPEKKKVRGSNRVSSFYIFTKLTAPLMEGGISMKTLLKELLKWLIITITIGFIVWVVMSLYKFFRNKIRGS